MSTRHSFPQPSFDALAAGAGYAGAIAALRSAQLSKRLLLIRAVVDAAGRTHPDAVRAARLGDSYDLLAGLQRRSPLVFETVVLHPHVGAWAAHCLHRLRKPAPSAVPLSVDLGHLAAIAAAAAIRSDTSFEITVAARNGVVMLPTLGSSAANVRPFDHMAVIRRASGPVEIAIGDTTIELPTDLAQSTPGWLPLRRLKAVAAGRCAEVFLDDIDPFRDCQHLPVASRLDTAAVDAWQRAFQETWSTLVRYHPTHAETVVMSLASIVPLDAETAGGSASAAASNAFGAVASTLPATGQSLANTLVHELQHVKLNALLDLFRLYEPADGELHYAPWRTDPRPLGGLLHGTYAHLGMADFWRVQRQVAAKAQATLAEFEFARCREQAADAARRLAGSERLTALGTRFVANMLAALKAWRGLPVRERMLKLALDATTDHRLTWRLRNLRPDRGGVKRLAAAWVAHRACPDVEPPPNEVIPATTWGDSGRLRLLHLRVSDPMRFRELASGGAILGEEVPGATSADLACARGAHAEAAEAYRAEVIADPANPASWAGLALACSHARRGASAMTLVSYPELVYAVHREIGALTGVSVDPEPLASWLARVCAPAR